VKEKPVAFTRRKFSAVVRKGIISYYTEQEKQEIARAAAFRELLQASTALSEGRDVEWSAPLG